MVSALPTRMGLPRSRVFVQDVSTWRVNEKRQLSPSPAQILFTSSNTRSEPRCQLTTWVRPGAIDDTSSSLISTPVQPSAMSSAVATSLKTVSTSIRTSTSSGLAVLFNLMCLERTEGEECFSYFLRFEHRGLMGHWNLEACDLKAPRYNC